MNKITKKKVIRVKPEGWFDVETETNGTAHISFYDEDNKVIEIIANNEQIKTLTEDLSGY